MPALNTRPLVTFLQTEAKEDYKKFSPRLERMAVKVLKLWALSETETAITFEARQNNLVFTLSLKGQDFGPGRCLHVSSCIYSL